MKVKKAGAIIFTRNPKPLVLLIKSSNPMFGGTAWQLPKGMIDPGESPDSAAFREAKEEAGILEKDVVKISDLGIFKMSQLKHPYGMKMIAVETHKAKVSGTYHFETGATKWFTIEDAAKVIRSDQKPILDKFIENFNQNTSSE